MARRTNGGTLKIDDRVLDILCRFRCTRNIAHRHEETLDRADYQALNEILEALGGKWTKASKALPGGGHVFPEGTDAATLIEAAMMTGSVKDPKVGDFFETPQMLARDIVLRANVSTGMSVLEPSAGHGRIAVAARDAGGVVLCIEVDGDRRAKLAGIGGLVVPPGRHDFLERTPEQAFDAVLMNPPFSREQDMVHVTHALGFLKPGGKLVAVTGPGWKFRQTKAADAFRALVDRWRARVEDLPEDTFKESGTGVRSCLLTING